MKKNKQREKEVQEQLGEYREEYERIKARIQKVGFISKGSIIKRRLTCGNPTCQCHSDPEKLHGPYYQISWKEKGKTVSYFLSPEMVHSYRQWIDNHRKLMTIINEMLAISRKAGDCIRTRENRKDKAGKGMKKK